jgi:hypothetical protein
MTDKIKERKFSSDRLTQKTILYEKFNNKTFYENFKKSSVYPYPESAEMDEYILWVNQN